MFFVSFFMQVSRFQILMYEPLKHWMQASWTELALPNLRKWCILKNSNSNQNQELKLEFPT